MALWHWRREPSLHHHHPWQHVDRMMRDLGLLSSALGTQPAAREFPAVNVWTSADKALVTAEIPGVAPDDLDVSVENEVLTIRGSREPDELAGEERWVRQERGYGSFARSVALPFAVEGDQVSATYRNGVLTVELPRAEAQKPHKIEVKG